MKYIIFLLLTISLYANENYAYDTKFGFLSKGTILSNFKDARGTLSKWINDSASIDNGRVTVKYYPDSKTLYHGLKNGTLDMIILNLDFFFKNKKEIDLIGDNYWTLLSNRVKHIQFLLIANKSSNVNSFRDIKGKTISLKNEALTSEIWLEKQSLAANKKSHKKILRNIKVVNKESTSLLNVFFKKTDLAIITKDAWETMSELNPAIKKKVKIVAESKKIHIPFVGIFSKDISNVARESFKNLTKDIFSLEGGKQISNLLKFDTVYWVENKDINSLEKYYGEYFSLKKRYK